MEIAKKEKSTAELCLPACDARIEIDIEHNSDAVLQS